MKVDVIEQWRDRLRQLQKEEERQAGPVSSINIEYQLRWLATRAGARNPNLLHGAALCFDSYTPEQRRKLYGLLKYIEDDFPRFRIHWTRFFEKEEKCLE